MLFVDDDYPQWSAILDVVAQQRNWSVTSVGSIEAARKELEQNMTKYDLILLDLGFPSQSVQGHDGVRLLHDTARTIPIIVLTASNTAADIRTAVECLNQGAWEYFTKPDVDWLRLMNEADNLAAAGRLIRDRMQVLPNAPGKPLNTRVMFYIPMPKGERLIDNLRKWLTSTYGGATTPLRKILAQGDWEDNMKKQVTDNMVLVYVFADMEQQIKPTQEAIFEKARELLTNLPREKYLGVEIGTVFYLVDPIKIRVIPPVETAGRTSKWPAL
jgi:CheY-like chemotaxis protein